MSEAAIANTGKRPDRDKRRLLLIAGVLVLIVAVVVVAVPVWLIMPFKPQTPRGIWLSYWFRRLSPALTIAATIGILAVSTMLWRAARWWTKGFLIILALISLLPVWASRQNHFEWMFRPLPKPGYAKGLDARSVTDEDMVMAVEVNGEAVAYPIREMAYHHVVEDVVGGVPLAATY